MTTPKKDHPKLKAFLKAYRAKGKQAEVTNTNALWPLAAARAWTGYLSRTWFRPEENSDYYLPVKK